jgi:hypothetical protein
MSLSYKSKFLLYLLITFIAWTATISYNLASLIIAIKSNICSYVVYSITLNEWLIVICSIEIVRKLFKIPFLVGILKGINFHKIYVIANYVISLLFLVTVSCLYFYGIAMYVGVRPMCEIDMLNAISIASLILIGIDLIVQLLIFVFFETFVLCGTLTL